MRLLPTLILPALILTGLAPLTAQELQAIELEGAEVSAIERGHRYAFEDGASIEITKTHTTPGEDPLQLPLLLTRIEGLRGFEAGKSRKTWHHVGRYALLTSARSLTHEDGRAWEERRFMLPTLFGMHTVHARTTPAALERFLRAHYEFIVFQDTTVFVGGFNVHVPTGPEPQGYYRKPIGVELTLPGDLTTSLILRGEKTQQDAFVQLRAWVESEMANFGSRGKTSGLERLSFESEFCTGIRVVDRDAPVPVTYIAAARDIFGHRLLMLAKVHNEDADTFTEYVTGRLEGAEAWGPDVPILCVEGETGYAQSYKWSSWMQDEGEHVEQRLFTAGGEVKMRCGLYEKANSYSAAGERSLATKRERSLLQADEYTVEDAGETKYELFGVERTATRLHFKWWTIEGGLDVLCWQNPDGSYTECVIRALTDAKEDRTKKVREALTERE